VEAVATLRDQYENRIRLDRAMKQKHRDETGSYYTPFDLAEELVRIAVAQRLSQLLGEPVSGILLTLRACSVETEKLEMYLKHILEFHVIDPSAGDGVFAAAYLNMLESLAAKTSVHFSEVARAVGHVVVMDIQPEPVDQYGSLVSEHFGIDRSVVPAYCCDALEETSLFHRTLEEDVMAYESFDLVIGNPPYIGEKHHRALFEKARLTRFGADYYEKNMDYFYYFIHLGLDLLKVGGVLGYITTGYFLTADGAKKLRTRLSEAGSFSNLAKFHGRSLFEDASGQSNLIFHFVKGVRLPCRYVEVAPSNKTSSPLDGWIHAKAVTQLESHTIVSDTGNFYFSVHQDEMNALEEIERACELRLDQVLGVRQGIVSGLDRVGDTGVFVLTEEETERLEIEKDLLVPFFKNSQIRRGVVELEPKFQLIYLPGVVEDFEEHYPHTHLHLKSFQVPLSRRREVVKGVRPWYALQWPRDPGLFTGPKIVVPHRSTNNAFAYSDQAFYASADVYYLSAISGQTTSPEDLMTVSGILGASLYHFWLSHRGKRKGAVLELYATPLKQMPLPKLFDNSSQYRGIKKIIVENIGWNNLDMAVEMSASVDSLLYDWLGLSLETRQTIERFLTEKRRT
jgi:adenine-specific DNA-methyltransferase